MRCDNHVAQGLTSLSALLMIDARGPLLSSGLLAGSNTKRIWLVVSPKLCVSAHCCARMDWSWHMD